MRKIIFTLCLALCTLMLCSCSLLKVIPNNSNKTQPEKAPPIVPVLEDGGGNSTPVTLYYGFADENLLTTETRALELPLDERVETFIVRALLQGPSADRLELRALFPEKTRVLSVEENEKILIVTLSSEFFNPPKDAPATWEQDPVWVKKVKDNRLLCLQSIVNTITELGQFERVQLMVDVAGTNESRGQRVKLSLFGLKPEESDALLEPYSRVPTASLSPRVTVENVMISWQSGDWERMMKFIAVQDVTGVARPTRDEMQTAFLSAPKLSQSAVLDTWVLLDGLQATVTLNYTITRSDESTATGDAVPVKLIREQECWKMTYASLRRLMER